MKEIDFQNFGLPLMIVLYAYMNGVIPPVP
jgi:hypothetical protein